MQFQIILCPNIYVSINLHAREIMELDVCCVA